MTLDLPIEALYEKALALRGLGHIEEAGKFEEQAAALLENLKKQVQEQPDALETASTLLFLAEKEWSLGGDDPRILSMIERATAIRENHLGPTHPLVAPALAALAEFHFLAGRWEKAEPYYRRAIALYEKDPTLSGYAKCCGGLAQTLAHLNQPLEADAFFVTAIDLCHDPEKDKRVLYFLYIYRADGLDKIGRSEQAQAMRAAAQKLLPRSNPGEAGFHV